MPLFFWEDFMSYEPSFTIDDRIVYLMSELTELLESSVFSMKAASYGVLNPYSYEDVLSYHRIMYQDHKEKLDDLMTWMLKTTYIHPILRSCIFHYECLLIFGSRSFIGRWQTLFLSHYQFIFGCFPVDLMLMDRKDTYNKILKGCILKNDGTDMIEYLLEMLLKILKIHSKTEQVEKLLLSMGRDTLSAKALMDRIGLKHRPTFRKNYLLPAIELGFIEMTLPSKPNSRYQKYKRCDEMKLTG